MFVYSYEIKSLFKGEKLLFDNFTYFQTIIISFHHLSSFSAFFYENCAFFLHLQSQYF